MRSTSGFIRFLYGTAPGRICLKGIMRLRLDRAAVRFLRSPRSRFIIGSYCKHHGVALGKAERESFRSFRDFFVRTRPSSGIDITPGHLIAPCDGWLSVHHITADSRFFIKSSCYRLKDILREETLARNYIGGVCLIFRLCASDYHRYCYIDDGYQGKNHFVPGLLHSVQPIACETVPVYALNRRCWSLLTTEHFGPVVECEVGALVIGGICNRKENERFCKGAEKGHFEPFGSTILLLFEPGQIRLHPRLRAEIAERGEVRVRMGQWIGTAGGHAGE